jgi:hypothetical protein
LNEVPTGVLNRFWGDVAFAAATEAAGGVRTVVQNAGGFPQEPGAAPAARTAPQPGQGLALPRDTTLRPPQPQAAAAN